ncbi:coiled-coil domain-containing protein 186 isoform X2 [Andrena cerasifolii]|uniref:coiled-coil domain-containing protein 186 isoform X2 n=1 Tax=Andrena cerasifolii TaxID=2819439 RepID=UPI0040382CC6
MDEEKSELSSKDEASSENVSQTDSSGQPNVLVTEATDSPILQDLEVNKGAMMIQEKIEQAIRSEMDSVLLNDEKKRHALVEGNSINVSTKSSTSLSDLSDNEFLKYRGSFDDVDTKEKSLQKSSSYGDLRLPSTVSSDSYSCVVSNDGIESVISNGCEEFELVCKDEEEILFTMNTKPSEDIIIENHVNFDVPKAGAMESVIQNCDLDAKSIGNGVQTEVLTNVAKLEKLCKNEEQKPWLVRSTRSQSNAMVRPSLVDDSKLVKISLPANPINIMQSNAQFLNKSRNLLNFITEKSTNIMEKALLPQHLTMKYNSVMKSIDSTYSDRRYGVESCSAKSPLTEVTFDGDSKLMEKAKSTCSLKSPMDTQSDRNECTLNCEETPMPAVYGNESTCLNVKRNDRIPVDSKLSSSKEMETHFIGGDISKVNDNIPCRDINGKANEYINSVVMNSEGNNSSSNETVTDNIYQKEEQATEFESSKLSLLKHPAYMTLLKDYADMKAKCLKFQEKVEYLEERNRTLEAESKGEIYSVQIETLERTINRLTSELHTSLTTQEMLRKEYTAANKERESMVMKYAVSEKQLIDTQRAREYAERRTKEMGRQQELLQSKLREMQGERTRICNILDGKCREATDLQKEVEKLKEDVNMREIKLKWTQSKLKTEMDLQKETQQKLDKASAIISGMKEECEQVRKETQESMRKFQQSEENKAVTLDQQLKEQQARLILERHVTEDKEMLRVQLQKEVETLTHRQQVLIEENNTLSLKIQDTEMNRFNYESSLSNLKTIADQRQKEIVELLGKVSELETLKVQLQHKDKHLASIESEIDQLRAANEELQADMLACRQKEAEMLDFTQKLTDKNVRLQSGFTAIEATTKELEEEHGPLHERIKNLTGKVKVLEESLAREQKTRKEECEILARHLAEQTQAAQNLAQKLEDSQGENAVLKRKQQLSMKEMTRELQQCRKKLDVYETSSPYNSLGVGSRTGSNISLNTGDTLNGALSDNSMNGEQTIQTTEPSRQALIDRIIRLQEENAKKAEKLDFFEEHSRTLVEELQKKTRVIQNYILHESSGAMGSNERDRYKAELARHGGIMASVYNQRVSDDNMTLELSLEINQKLQAVLEDALFKNITLKDNIDTLGEEIARLTMQNRQRKIVN